MPSKGDQPRKADWRLMSNVDIANEEVRKQVEKVLAKSPFGKYLFAKELSIVDWFGMGFKLKFEIEIKFIVTEESIFASDGVVIPLYFEKYERELRRMIVGLWANHFLRAPSSIFGHQIAVTTDFPEKMIVIPPEFMSHLMREFAYDRFIFTNLPADHIQQDLQDGPEEVDK